MASKIGELLIQHKLITQQQLDEALKAQRMYGGKLGTNLVEKGFLDDTKLAQFLAKQFQMPSATFGDFEAISPEILKLVNREIATRKKIIPLRMEKKLIVAISDPNDLDVIDEISFQSGKGVQVVVAPEIWIVAALERYYNVARDIRFIRVADSVIAPGFEEMEDRISIVPVGEEIKAESYRSVVPMPTYVERLITTKSKEDVFDALLDFLGPVFPRMAVFVNRGKAYSGWVIRGFAMRARDFATVQIPSSEETALKELFDTGAEYHGRLSSMPQNAQALAPLNLPDTQRIHMFPVPFKGKSIAAILGVSEGEQEDISEGTIGTVNLACQKAGMALEMLHLQKKIEDLPKQP